MSLQKIRNNHPLAYAAAACALAVACFTVVPAEGLDPLVASLVQTALAALCMLCVLAAFDPSSLRWKMRRGTQSRTALFACGVLALVALAAGVAAALLSALGGREGGSLSFFVSPMASPGGVALFLLLCLVTGVFEEALFRGIVFKGFATALENEERPRPVLVAAVVQAMVFGLLHVTTSTSLESAIFTVAAVQTLVKPVQAALFGFVMAGLLARTGNLWLLVGTHAAFNALSEALLFALTGALPATYATGQPADLAVLLATTVLLVPFAIHAASCLKKPDGCL
ncbi:CPBP family intramembrane glutamic endopeptidase [Gordonibacter massiliensis (ex Traore et al. 2017)]|uniref:CPBP family intramembrane glutamic endopeptidase n=1 Tax=Gordonibacter massiliensis (ex Traore et al. 2017) TaxID=1841863 RepID=UPI001C8C5735|nr:CPBP family intramembrane glutamic endopeptidase [Gordonibacter massiliensis (ex Traore et al. 2017)]MBX9032577.1 CPBP family intramembrane metalloprotease [Gordonibacter massiliensis (ex Traore et al. 2017)]